MTTDELARLGKAMRDAQRLYFRTRDRDDLQAARLAEIRFDDAVKAALDPRPAAQKTLFDPRD